MTEARGTGASGPGAPALLRVVVGTAGHVDHGKTALVKALTGVDTARLPEEKRRGITLEAGYAHVLVPGLGVAGFVDVPGHERFLRAMVGAAAGVDVALLCVAADEGPMPQTAEHLDVLRLLGVHQGIVALTKSDLLEELGSDHRDLVLLELRELLAGSALEGAPIIEVSARSGAGLEKLRHGRRMRRCLQLSDVSRPRPQPDRPLRSRRAHRPRCEPLVPPAADDTTSPPPPTPCPRQTCPPKSPGR